jgi:YesN/AraC family two-component response regulator
LDLHTHIVQLLPGTYRVLKARNGREALATMREVHPKLILLDLMMPELDGFGVLEAMQADETLRHIPVIVSTAQVLSEADLARLNRGVTSILGKRLFTETETLEHIKTALERSKKLGTETQRLVRKALAFLHEHYTEPISLETTAEHIHVSKQYLARCFPQEMGITLVSYLNRYRVNQAKMLLEIEEKTVTDVALEVGFSSSSYFSRVFRQETGTSPSEYRQTLRT